MSERIELLETAAKNNPYASFKLKWRRRRRRRRYHRWGLGQQWRWRRRFFMPQTITRWWRERWRWWCWWWERRQQLLTLPARPITRWRTEEGCLWASSSLIVTPLRKSWLSASFSFSLCKNRESFKEETMTGIVWDRLGSCHFAQTWWLSGAQRICPMVLLLPLSSFSLACKRSEVT